MSSIVKFCRGRGTFVGCGTLYLAPVHVHEAELLGFALFRYPGRSFLDCKEPHRVQYAQLICSAQKRKSSATSVKTDLVVVDRRDLLKVRRNSSFRVARLRKRSARRAAFV